MVEALDFEPKVTIEQIEGTETRRLACNGCDWMETGGSKAVATRKKNAHLAEHRAATEGAAGVPTIMDAIKGEVEMPEGAFREPVPVGDVEYLRKLREEAEAVVGHPEGHGDYSFDDDLDRTKDLAGEPIQTSNGWVVTPHAATPEDIAAAEFVAEMVEEGGEQFTKDVMDNVAREMFGPRTHPTWTPEEINRRVETGEALVPKESFHFPRIQDVEPAPAGPIPPHTRTTTAYGPDYCAECSAQVDDYVVWPCAEVGDRGRLAVALTRSRLAAQMGPSDADKDQPDSEWHKARADSVSATLAAKLGSAADVDYLIAREVRERINAARFWGNAYTRWGREREPHIEQAALVRHGIEPESHLFFSRANRRHTASPDGIAIHQETGAVALGEFKTSGKELTWNKMVANGYYDQVQWQLYVLEASHAWLMWEWRHGEGKEYDTYVPEPGGEHLIMRDEERIAELVERADRFLAALDAAREEPAQQAAVDPQLLYLVSEHLEAKAAAKRAEEELREFCEANGVKSMEIEGVAKVSYSFGSPRKSFNTTTFREHHPELYEAYVEEGAPPERATLRVTPVKGDDEG